MATTEAQAQAAADLMDQREAVQSARERHFWNVLAEDQLIEAISEQLHGKRAERQRMIDAGKSGDMAELGRLVWSHVEPYLEHELEREL